MYYNVFVLFFVWCLCMAIYVSVQHNGGFLPGFVLLTQCYYHRGTNAFKCHEEALYLQPMMPPKGFDIFPPDGGGCSESLDAFRFFFNNTMFAKLIL